MTLIADDTDGVAKSLSRLRAARIVDVAECRRLAMVRESEDKRPPEPAAPKRTGNAILDWRNQRAHEAALTAFGQADERTELDLYHARVQKAQDAILDHLDVAAGIRATVPFGESLDVAGPAVMAEECATPGESWFMWAHDAGKATRGSF